MPKNNLQGASVLNLLSPVVITATNTASGVAMTAGYDEALVIVSVGVCTDGSHTVTIEESADDSTYAAVTGAAFSAFTASTDLQSYWGTIDLKKRKKYIRAVTTVAGATTGTLVGVVAVLHEAASQPNSATVFSV